MAIEITPAAEKFIRRIVRFAGLPDGAGFRLTVSPGGCAGLGSEFDVLSEPPPGDTRYEYNGLTLFFPPETRELLEGATIDCTDTPASSGLVFRAPKGAAAACAPEPSSTVRLVTLGMPPGSAG